MTVSATALASTAIWALKIGAEILRIERRCARCGRLVGVVGSDTALTPFGGTGVRHRSDPAPTPLRPHCSADRPAQRLDPRAIDAEVAAPEPGGAAHMDHARAAVEQALQVVDETERRARALRVQVVAAVGD